MTIYLCIIIIPALFLSVESSSIRGRNNKNELVPLTGSGLDSPERDNNLKVVSNEPFIIQLHVPKHNDSKPTREKDKKRKRKRVSKLRKKHRTRRDLMASKLKHSREEKSHATEIPLAANATEDQVKNITKNTVNRAEILKALSSYSRNKQKKKSEPEVHRGDDDDSQKAKPTHSSKSPIVKMIYPSTPKLDRHSHKYTYKDLMADRKRLEQKINYIKNMFSANDSTTDDAVRIRRRSESDRTANKIAKMFLTLSAVNGLHDKRRSRCKEGDDDDDDRDRVQDVWEKEQRSSPNRKASSSNAERYKVKKWIEFMKNKRSSGKTCPCMAGVHGEDSDAFPLEQKLPKDYFLMERSRSSEESSETIRDPYYHPRDRPYRRRYNKGQDGQENKLKALSKNGKKKLDLPLNDLELYRSRAKQILQNAEDILDRIKEEEEKRLSAPSILMSQLKELTSRIQSDPRNNENDLIRKIQKNLGWKPLAKSKDGSDGNTFIDNVKSYILDPYEKAKELTDESTKMLSSYLLRNLGKIQQSSEELDAKQADDETRDKNDNSQVYFGQVPTKEEEKPLSASLAKEGSQPDLLSNTKQELKNWEDTISTILQGADEKVQTDPYNTQETFKNRMEDIIKEQQKKVDDWETSPHSNENSKETDSGDKPQGRKSKPGIKFIKPIKHSLAGEKHPNGLKQKDENEKDKQKTPIGSHLKGIGKAPLQKAQKPEKDTLGGDKHPIRLKPKDGNVQEQGKIDKPRGKHPMGSHLKANTKGSKGLPQKLAKGLAEENERLETTKETEELDKEILEELAKTLNENDKDSYSAAADHEIAEPQVREQLKTVEESEELKAQQQQEENEDARNSNETPLQMNLNEEVRDLENVAVEQGKPNLLQEQQRKQDGTEKSGEKISGKPKVENDGRPDLPDYDLLTGDETPGMLKAVGESSEGFNGPTSEETLVKKPETEINHKDLESKSTEDNVEEVIDPLLRKAEQLETELIRKAENLENKSSEDNLEEVFDPLLKKGAQLQTDLKGKESDLENNSEDILEEAFDPLLQMAEQLETKLNGKEQDLANKSAEDNMEELIDTVNSEGPKAYSKIQDPSNIEAVRGDAEIQQKDTDTVQDSLEKTGSKLTGEEHEMEGPKSDEELEDETDRLKLERQNVKPLLIYADDVWGTSSQEGSNEDDGGSDNPVKASLIKEKNSDGREMAVSEEESPEIDEDGPLTAAKSEDQRNESVEDSDETPLKEALEKYDDEEIPLRQTSDTKEDGGDENEDDDDDDSPLRKAMKKPGDTPSESKEEKENEEESRSRKALNKEKEDKYENPLRKSLGTTEGKEDETTLRKTLESTEDDDDDADVSPMEKASKKGEDTPLRKSLGDKEDNEDEIPLRKNLESKEDEDDDDDADVSPITKTSKKGKDTSLGKSLGEKEDTEDETPLRKTLHSKEDEEEDDDEDPNVSPMTKATKKGGDKYDTPLRKSLGDKEDTEDEVPLRKNLQSKEDKEDETPLRQTQESKEDEEEDDDEDPNVSPMTKATKKGEGKYDIPLRKNFGDKEDNEDETPLRQTQESKEDEEEDDDEDPNVSPMTKATKKGGDKYDTPLRKSLGDKEDEVPLKKTLQSKEEEQDNGDDDSSLRETLENREEGENNDEESPLRKTLGSTEDENDQGDDDDDDDDDGSGSSSGKSSKKQQDKYDTPLRKSLEKTQDKADEVALRKTLGSNEDEGDTGDDNDGGDGPLRKSSKEQEDKYDTPVRKTLGSKGDEDDQRDDDDGGESSLRKTLGSTEDENDQGDHDDGGNGPLRKSSKKQDKYDNPVRKTLGSNEDEDDTGDDNDGSDGPLRKSSKKQEDKYDIPLRKTLGSKEDEGDHRDDDDDGGDNPLRKSSKEQEDKHDTLRKSLENKEEEGGEVAVRKTLGSKEDKDDTGNDDGGDGPLRKSSKKLGENKYDTPLSKTLKKAEDKGDDVPLRKTLGSKEDEDDQGDDDDRRDSPLRKSLEETEDKGEEGDEVAVRKTLGSKEDEDDTGDDNGGDSPLRKSSKKLGENKYDTPLSKSLKKAEDKGDDVPLRKTLGSKEFEDDNGDDDEGDSPLRKTLESKEDEIPLKKTLENKKDGEAEDDETASKETLESKEDRDEPLRADNPLEETDIRPSSKSKADDNLDRGILKEANPELEETSASEEETPLREPMKQNSENDGRGTSEEDKSGQEEQNELEDRGETRLKATLNEEDNDLDAENSDEAALQGANPQDVKDSNDSDTQNSEEFKPYKDEENLKSGHPTKQQKKKDEGDETSAEVAMNRKDDGNIKTDEESLLKSSENLDEDSDNLNANLRAEKPKETSLISTKDDESSESTQEKENDETRVGEENPRSEENSEEKSGEAIRLALESPTKDTDVAIDEADDELSLKSAKPEVTDERAPQNEIGSDETLEATLSNENSDETSKEAKSGEAVKATLEEDSNEGTDEGDARLKAANPTETDPSGDDEQPEDTQKEEETPLRLSLNQGDSETKTENGSDEDTENPLRNASQENELDSHINETPLKSAKTIEETGQEDSRGDSEEAVRAEETTDDLENAEDTPLKSEKLVESKEDDSTENSLEDREDSPLGENLIQGTDPEGSGSREENGPPSSLPDLLQMPEKPGKLKVPKSIGEIMRDLDGKEKDDITSLRNLNPDKIDDIIGKIGEAEQQNLLEHPEVDCRKECACADEIDTRSRNIGRYEIVKDFLHWMKDLQLNRVLTDD